MRISHAFFGVVTDRVRECRDFYTRHLGFEIVFQLQWYVHLRAREGSVDIAFLHPRHPSQPVPLRSPLAGQGVWLSFEVSDARQEQERLAMEGVEIVAPLRDEVWGERHFLIRDPSGAIINIAQRIDAVEGFFDHLAGMAPDPPEIPAAPGAQSSSARGNDKVPEMAAIPLQGPVLNAIRSSGASADAFDDVPLATQLPPPPAEPFVRPLEDIGQTEPEAFVEALDSALEGKALEAPLASQAPPSNGLDDGQLEVAQPDAQTHPSEGLPAEPKAGSESPTSAPSGVLPELAEYDESWDVGALPRHDVEGGGASSAAFTHKEERASSSVAPPLDAWPNQSPSMADEALEAEAVMPSEKAPSSAEAFEQVAAEHTPLTMDDLSTHETEIESESLSETVQDSREKDEEVAPPGLPTVDVASDSSTSLPPFNEILSEEKLAPLPLPPERVASLLSTDFELNLGKASGEEFPGGELHAVLDVHSDEALPALSPTPPSYSLGPAVDEAVDSDGSVDITIEAEPDPNHGGETQLVRITDEAKEETLPSTERVEAYQLEGDSEDWRAQLNAPIAEIESNPLFNVKRESLRHAEMDPVQYRLAELELAEKAWAADETESSPDSDMPDTPSASGGQDLPSGSEASALSTDSAMQESPSGKAEEEQQTIHGSASASPYIAAYQHAVGYDDQIKPTSLEDDPPSFPFLRETAAELQTDAVDPSPSVDETITSEASDTILLPHPVREEWDEDQNLVGGEYASSPNTSFLETPLGEMPRASEERAPEEAGSESFSLMNDDFSVKNDDDARQTDAGPETLPPIGDEPSDLDDPEIHLVLDDDDEEDSEASVYSLETGSWRIAEAQDDANEENEESPSAQERPHLLGETGQDMQGLSLQENARDESEEEATRHSLDGMKSVAEQGEAGEPWQPPMQTNAEDRGDGEVSSQQLLCERDEPRDLLAFPDISEDELPPDGYQVLRVEEDAQEPSQPYEETPGVTAAAETPFPMVTPDHASEITDGEVSESSIEENAEASEAVDWERDAATEVFAEPGDAVMHEEADWEGPSATTHIEGADEEAFQSAEERPAMDEAGHPVHSQAPDVEPDSARDDSPSPVVEVDWEGRTERFALRWQEGAEEESPAANFDAQPLMASQETIAGEWLLPKPTPLPEAVTESLAYSPMDSTHVGIEQAGEDSPLPPEAPVVVDAALHSQTEFEAEDSLDNPPIPEENAPYSAMPLPEEWQGEVPVESLSEPEASLVQDLDIRGADDAFFTHSSTLGAETPTDADRFVQSQDVDAHHAVVAEDDDSDLIRRAHVLRPTLFEEPEDWRL